MRKIDYREKGWKIKEERDKRSGRENKKGGGEREREG